MYRRQLLFLACITLISSIIGEQTTQQSKRKPNVVVIIVDDLGIGDIGCYGNTTINTVNIDSIAKQGVKFEHNVAAETVCTPSRAALLTGRYAIRSGMESDEKSIRVVLSLLGSSGLPENETTFSRVYQQNGYKTALFGKWHLGLHKQDQDYRHHPLSHGIDYYYGMPLSNFEQFGQERLYGPTLDPKRVPWFMIVRVPYNTLKTILYSVLFSVCALLYISMNKTLKRVLIFMSLLVVIWVGYNVLLIKFNVHMNAIIMRNKEVVEQPAYLPTLTERLTKEAVHYIRENKDKPFLSVISYHKVHVALEVPHRFRGKSQHGAYGDTMLELDWSVGEILNELKQNGIDDNTFVYFTSDHGPGNFLYLHGELHGGYSGKFKGGKGSNWEGGIRVPTMAMWPGVIQPNTIYKSPISGLDLYPTLMNILNISSPTKDIAIDGIDFLSKLQPDFTPREDRFLFHYCGTSITAVTFIPASSSHVWKMHYIIQDWPSGQEYFSTYSARCFGEGMMKLVEPLLYDLSVDERESSPISSTSQVYKDILVNINEKIEQHKQNIVPVENQLTSRKQAGKFSRITCCNFPFCSCKE